MPISRTKTWIAGAQLPAAELNALEANIVDNQQDVGNPRTKSYDMNGNELILDGDADSSITADTDDRLDLRLQGQDLFRFHGTVASAVDGIDFTGAATASPSTVAIAAQGSSANINLSLAGKGTGRVLIDGESIAVDSEDQILATQVFGWR